MEEIEKMQIFGDIYYRLHNIIRIVDDFNSNLISQIPDRQKELHKLTLEVKDLVDKIVYEIFNKKVTPNKNTTYMELAYALKEAGIDIDIEECKRIDQIDQVYESGEK